MTLAAAKIRAMMLPFVLVYAVICYARKEKAVGGWLLFFCGQIYFSMAASVLLIATNYTIYLSPPAGGLGRYLALLVVRFCPLLAGVLAAVAVTMLLSQADLIALDRLRYILVGQVCTAALVVLVDIKFFPASVVERIVGLAVVCVWVIYFFVSRRVDSVFLRHNWGGTGSRSI